MPSIMNLAECNAVRTPKKDRRDFWRSTGCSGKQSDVLPIPALLLRAVWAVSPSGWTVDSRAAWHGGPKTSAAARGAHLVQAVFLRCHTGTTHPGTGNQQW